MISSDFKKVHDRKQPVVDGFCEMSTVPKATEQEKAEFFRKLQADQEKNRGLNLYRQGIINAMEIRRRQTEVLPDDTKEQAGLGFEDDWRPDLSDWEKATDLLETTYVLLCDVMKLHLDDVVRLPKTNLIDVEELGMDINIFMDKYFVLNPDGTIKRPGD